MSPRYVPTLQPMLPLTACCFKHGRLWLLINNTLADRDPAGMILEQSVIS